MPPDLFIGFSPGVVARARTSRLRSAVVSVVLVGGFLVGAPPAYADAPRCFGKKATIAGTAGRRPAGRG